MAVRLATSCLPRRLHEGAQGQPAKASSLKIDPACASKIHKHKVRIIDAVTVELNGIDEKYRLSKRMKSYHTLNSTYPCPRASQHFILTKDTLVDRLGARCTANIVG